MATAVRSEPPRPRVVISSSALTPWKPATMAISPSAKACRTRSASMLTIRALVCTSSVWMRTWLPVKLRARCPSPWIASDRSPMLTCSPVARMTSSSRSFGRSDILCASPINRSVSPAMAETTTTTSWPAARAKVARRATFLIRSGSPTEVPPYF